VRSGLGREEKAAAKQRFRASSAKLGLRTEGRRLCCSWAAEFVETARMPCFFSPALLATMGQGVLFYMGLFTGGPLPHLAPPNKWAEAY
jgi:hypothetical protein